MAWEIEHFKGKDFRANPQNINRKWQPKKGIAKINASLIEEWYTPATKADIEANYLALVALEHDKLLELSEDNTQPYIVNLIAKNLISEWWFDILEKMLDRSIGKPKQTVDSNIQWDLNIKQFDHIDKLVGSIKNVIK